MGRPSDGQAVRRNLRRVSAPSRFCKWASNSDLTMRRAMKISMGGIEDLLRISDVVIAQYRYRGVAVQVKELNEENGLETFS